MKTTSRLIDAATLSLLGLLACVLNVFAQVNMSGGNYSQNFNSLASSSTATWTDNSTLAGWYAATNTGNPVSVYLTGSGSGTSGGLYSLGTAAGERALGSLVVNANNQVAYGVRMKNDTLVAKTNFSVAYNGEQWRQNGNTAVQKLGFSYRISSSAITSPDPASSLTWTAVTNLDFNSPITGSAGAALDGNATANRTGFAAFALTNVTVQPGDEIFFRWLDVNDSGTDHCLAVDDVAVSFSDVPAAPSGPVPFVWTTTGGQWSVGGNWNHGTAPTNGVNLAFTGSGGDTTNDLTLSVGSITFSNGAGPYTLLGNALTLSNGVANQSANAQMINLPLALGADQAIAATAANVNIQSSVDTAGFTLTVNGASGHTISGPITGSGSLAKSGAGSATLNATNTFNGSTTIGGGTLTLANGAAIPNSSAVNITAGTLALAGAETIGSLAGGASGTVALSTLDLTTGANGGSSSYSGVITGTGKLIKTGAGTLTFDRTSAVGADFGLRIEGGTVDLNRGGSSLSGILGTGNRIELAGGTLQVTASAQANYPFTPAGLDIYSDSTFRFQRTTVNSQSPNMPLPLNFKSPATLTVAFNANITNGTHVFSALNTLEADAAVEVTAFTTSFTGPIVESGGSQSLTKLGPGTLNLDGTNSFTGAITNAEGVLTVNDIGNLSAGALVFAGGDLLCRNNRSTLALSNSLVLISNASIYGNSILTNSTRIVPFAADSITMAPGSTLTLRNAGPNANATGNLFVVRFTGGGFNLTEPVVVGHAGDLSGYNTQVEFYSDVAKPDQTVSGVISGSGSIIRNAAAEGGRTILTGANTYAGTTTVTRGTLLVNNTSGSGTSTGAVSVASAGVLGGTGTVAGVVTVGAGGTIAPGASIGTLTLGSAPVLGGSLLMEIDRNGGAPQADKIVFNSGATFGGTLIVTNIGAAAQNGDTFDLFDGSVGGAFASVNLPPGGLNHWRTNNLVVNGTFTFTNNNPVAQNLTLGVALGGAVSLEVIGGKFSPADADGDALSISGVGTATSGTAGFTASHVTYSASGSLGTNTFTYTVSDGLGGTDTKTVTVLVTAPQGANLVSGPTPLGGGLFELKYLGVPGEDYALEETSSITPPIVWTPVVTNTASGIGALTFTFTPVNQTGFFRTRHVP